MNVFVPYSSPLRCAEALWADQLRYNKQIIECRQIIAAIEGAKAWRNHPVCLMYKEHKRWLECYLWCFEAYRDSKKSVNARVKDGLMYVAEHWNDEANEITPSFLSDTFCLQHRKRLFTKSPDLYPQFAEYDKSDENWYYIDGQIVKYVNGKRVK